MDTADKLMKLAIDGDTGDDVEAVRDAPAQDVAADQAADGAEEVVEERTTTVRKVNRGAPAQAHQTVIVTD